MRTRNPYNKQVRINPHQQGLRNPVEIRFPHPLEYNRVRRTKTDGLGR